jgi:AraC family transcriptional regulator, regulatory protein of adaptative response / DNA-3-methyladenine glycosylase II
MTAPRDFEHRYRAIVSRDPRFDGYFFTAVTSTGIYCRPSCPARTPKREHVRFYPTAAAAQAAGFRACKRCIPGVVPGSPEWNLRSDVAGRAMGLIADGVIERDGVPGLAARLGYGERQLRRLLLADLGATPLALARAHRAHVARLLLETTALPVTEVAFAAGFASLRQFNETIRAVFEASPTELRERRHGRGRTPDTATDGDAPTNEPGPLAGHPIEIRLARREPFDFVALLAFLGPRAIPGVEAVADGCYRRSLRLPNGPATVELTDDGAAVRCRLVLADPRDLGPAVARVRRLLDLDADPEAVGEALGRDELLGSLVARSPGRRAPGAVDGMELAVRAVIGQQVSVAAARTIAGRLAAALGESLPGDGAGPVSAVGRLFPTAAAIADAPDELLPMPAARRRTVRALATKLAEGRVVLDAGTDRDEAVARLRAVPGVGTWTAQYIALRALGDPDVLLASDLGVHHAMAALGGPTDPTTLAAFGVRWAPWRSYATHHLWASLAGELAGTSTLTRSRTGAAR